MATIRISDLSADSTPSASDLIPVDGATTRKTTLAQAVAAARPLADQAEAEAGTDAAKAMTPLTTKQAIVAIGGANFATAAQGATADTAVQPGDLSTVATSGDYDDLSNKPTLSTVATSGDYDDLSNKPTLGSAAAEDTSAFATAAQGVLADAAVQPADLVAVQVPTGGTTGQVLAKSSNTDNDVEWTTANAGDVLGPSSVADSELAAFDTTTGKLLKKSTVQLSEIACATPTPPTFAYRFKEGQPLPDAFSFTRDGVKTRLTRAQLFATTASDVLAHQYASDGSYRGVLIEGPATHSKLPSRDFSSWSSNQRLGTITPNAHSGPFGDGGASKVTADSTPDTSHYVREQGVAVVSGEIVKFAGWAAAAELDWIGLRLTSAGFGSDKTAWFNAATGEIGTLTNIDAADVGVEAVNGGYSVWMRAEATASTSPSFIVFLCEGDGDINLTGDQSGNGVYLDNFGMITENGAASIPQYPVPVNDTETLVEGDALAADADAIGFNADEGTLFWKGSLDDISGHQPLLFAREDDTDGLSLSWYSGNVVLRWRGSSNVAVSAAFTPTVGEEFSVAAYYGPDGMGVSVNGDTPGTTASTVATPPTPTALRVGWGSNYSGSGYADIRQNGSTREFAVWDRALSAAEIQTLSTRGPAIGETLYAPEVLKKRYIDVGSSEWGTPSDDSKDAYAGVQAALTAGNGREIVFTNPYGGTRTYRFTSRSNGGLIMPQRARIIAEPGVELNFEDWGDSGTPDEFLYFKGTVPTAINLSGNAASGDTDIDLDDASTIARGDYLVITSNADFTTEDSTLGKVGEWIHVTGVSSNNVTFTTPLRGSYTTANTARVYRMSPTAGQLTLEGLKLTGVGLFNTNTTGDRGIWIENAINSHVIDCEVNYSDNLGITLVNVMGGSVRGNRVNLEPAGSNTQVRYGITLCNMCEDIDVTGNTAIGGREAIALSVTGTLPGVTRNIKIAHNVARGATRSGIATHDTHENIQIDHNLIEHCEQGIDSRIIGTTIRGNTIRNMGTISGTLNRAIYIGSGGGKLEISGNTIDTSAYGVVMRPDITHETTPDHIDISNNVMRGISQIAVTLENTTSSTATLGQVTVADNDIRCAASGSPIGVQLEGKWTAPIVMNNRFRGGNGGRSVYMHATANGTGTNGAINPTITGNVWDDYTEPFIEHDTGKRTIFGNYEFDATSLPSIASASALTLPTTGNVFAVTGTTTINTINHAAAYVGRVITLMFSGTLTVTTNANAGAANDIQCAGAANFSATANDQLMLVSNGTLWREVSRTAI